jgi:NADH dehydrogenase
MTAARIVVVGGGFAGTNLVKALKGRLPAGASLTLVSDESYTCFNPMLPEVVGASIFPEQVVAPIRQILRPDATHRFVMGRVSRIDLAERWLECDSLAGAHRIAYDELVLTVGNRARLDLIPGMQQHALPLKTMGDAMEIRNRVLRRVAQIELEDDPDKRAALGSFLVIGGGFSGVEVAGELVDCIHSLKRYYPAVRPQELSVTIVQNIDVLLPELPPALGAAARRSLEHRGVRVLLNAQATHISAQGVWVKLPGAQLDTLVTGETVISTIGTRANPLIESCGLPSERGRIKTGSDFRVQGVAGVWALGDCALVINQLDRKPSPPTAQFAVRQARVCARNLLAHLTARPLEEFSYRTRGMIASVGGRRGVAQVFGVHLAGLPAWLLWRAYYLLQMPTLGRKVRIFVEWTWGMFFPNDITHLRFTRSHELDGD